MICEILDDYCAPIDTNLIFHRQATSVVMVASLIGLFQVPESRESTGPDARRTGATAGGESRFR